MRLPVLRRSRLVACIALTCVASLAGATTNAHADAGLEVSPLIVDLEGAAGDVLTESITATASGDEPITVEILHADFGFTAADYQVTLIADDAPDTTAFSTRDWFSPLGKRTRIPVGVTRELPVRIEIPENTPGGTYLGAALVRVVPGRSDQPGSQVQAVPQAAVLYFIAVEGGDPPRADLRRFDMPGLVTRGPIRPKLRIENRGDEYFTFEGRITLSGPGKDDEVKVDRQFVVPGEPRDITTSADDKGPAGRISLGSRRLGLGRYTVTTRLRIEPTGTTLVERRTVWVIPTWARFVAALLALVVLASIALLVRWLVQRQVGEPEAPVQPETDETWDGDEPSAEDVDVDDNEDEVEDLDVDELDDEPDPFVR